LHVGAPDYRRGSLQASFKPRDLAVEPGKVVLPLRVAGREHDQPGHDCMPLAQLNQRFRILPPPKINGCDLPMAEGQIALPAGIAGIGSRQAVPQWRGRRDRT
jgi:hypothetical protein